MCVAFWKGSDRDASQRPQEAWAAEGSSSHRCLEESKETEKAELRKRPGLLFLRSSAVYEPISLCQNLVGPQCLNILL